MVSAGSLTVLGVAATLTPDPRGVETHTQLGLWPCGWYLASGYPCPTCGMTTAFSYATHGQPLTSLLTQPFGSALALAAAVAFWGGLHVCVFGSRINLIAERLLRPRSVMVTGGLLLAAWVYKVAVVRWS